MLFTKLKPLFDKDQLKEEIIDIGTKAEALSIGKILKSKIALNILLLADGTKTSSDIARTLKKQVSNISLYLGHLKHQGFVKINESGKVARTIKGLKVNFENGLK